MARIKPLTALPPDTDTLIKTLTDFCPPVVLRDTARLQTEQERLDLAFEMGRRDIIEYLIRLRDGG
jgi:hypothetical protein